MVDPSAPKRFEPAKPPSMFRSFTAWLESAVVLPGSPRSGLANRLAEYIADQLGDKTVAAHVSKWIRKGSIPEIPRLREIADWAQRDFDEVKALADRQIEERQSKPRRRGGGRTSSSKKSGRRRVS